MNRLTLWVVFGLSLAGNALLGFLVLKRPPRISAPAPAAAATTAQTAVKADAKSAAAVELSKRLAAPRTTANLREIASQLRAAGFTDSVVKMVMQALVNEELMRRQSDIFDWATVPYWKEPRPTPAQMKAVRELQKERRALLADLGLPLTPMEEAARRRQYGNLSEAKIAALEKIQQDYNELRQEMFERQRGGPTNGRDAMAQQKLLQEEQDRDVAALLTPEEKLELDFRNSRTAGQVRAQLREVDVNEEEYRSLYAAQKAYDDANPRDAGRGPSPAQGEAGLAAWDAYQTTARALLGEERYRQFLISSQLTMPSAKSFFAERPNVTVDQIQGLARIARSMPAEIQKEAGGPSLTGEERQARTAAVVDKYRTQIVRILGPQLAQEAEAAHLLPGLRSGSQPAMGMPGGG